MDKKQIVKKACTSCYSPLTLAELKALMKEVEQEEKAKKQANDKTVIENFNK